MRYCTRADLGNAIPLMTLTQLSNDDASAREPDESVIDNSVRQAEELVDGYLRGRYQLPLEPVPTVLRDAVIYLARHWLYQRRPEGALQQLQLMPAEGTDVYQQGTDFTVTLATGQVTRLASGSIPANASIKVSYTYTDPAKVTAADIIGGIDEAGLRTGLKAFQDSYNRLGFFPKIFIAPGFSTLNAVTAELIVAATRVGGVAYVDAPIGATVQHVLTGRGPLGNINFNTSSDRVRLCYPHVRVYDAASNGERLQPLSIRAAGLRAKIDNDHGYWWSSSNQPLLGVIGLERPLTARIDDATSEVNLLNENGITTVFNAYGTGLRLWGNRTAAWPSVTHMRNFENVRRTKDVVDESIRYSALQFVDQPITTALVTSLTESVNLFLRKLIGDGALVGGECWYDPARNPTTELEQGHALFNYKLTVPLPFERGTFETEITGDYLAKLGTV
ncbi:phage protein Gp36 family protein [Pseudomonas sp. PB106]|uniref:phage protein Gp36 family protein n=1 Tax=Pseudomonas sp. PB106 TaxID=2494699 RepID=UPI00131E4F17|nr:phage protein Gp36 family protein [Pseudomonas sp. PB106]KAE9641958.1 DUF1320 domain-containing protein [Pseudomonas sp. PB106]